MPYTVKEEVVYEEKVKSSLFIAHLNFAENIEQAKEYILQISQKHKQATHNCWAYQINSSIFHFSDDREPKGTAGKPIFGSLQKNNLHKIVCIVTRYFKGQKLGLRGLISAYSSLSKKAIEKAKLIEIFKQKTCELTCTYKSYTYIKYIMQKFFLTEEEVLFSMQVKVKFSFAKEKQNLLESLLKDYCKEISFKE